MNIDVIIPAYLPTNENLRLLVRALSSLEAQTYRDFKTTIVLNGCPRETKRKIEGLPFSFEIAICDLRRKASGAIARNAGIMSATAKLIAMLDADDQYHSEKLAKQVEFLNSHPEVDILGCLAYDFHDDNDIRESCFRAGQYEKHEQIANRLPHENVMCHSSTIIKRHVFQLMGSYEERFKPGDIWPAYGRVMYEDWDFWLHALTANFTFHNLPERLCYWSTNTSVER